MKKTEILFIGAMLLIIAVATSLNLLNSYRVSRDTQRKGDVQTVANALEAFLKDYDTYPESSEGRIVACIQGKEFRPCEWGEVFDEKYLKNLPRDPHFQDGVQYRYESNGRRFQIYASLEDPEEAEFDQKIHERGLSCGTQICNFGKSSGVTPLDKTIESYENELLLKQQ